MFQKTKKYGDGKNIIQTLDEITRKGAKMQTRAREQKNLETILKLFPSLDSYVNVLTERTSFLLRRESGLPLLPDSLFLFGVTPV